MWKRILIFMIGLVGTFSIVFAFDYGLFATGSYQSGGNVTGRVNIAPNGVSGSNIGLQLGDRVMMGAKYSINQAPLSWQLIEKHSYSDYGCLTNTDDPNTAKYNALYNKCNNPVITAWKSATTDVVASGPMAVQDSHFIRYCPEGFGLTVCPYSNGDEKEVAAYLYPGHLYGIASTVYNSLTTKDKTFIRDYDLTQMRYTVTREYIDGGNDYTDYYRNSRLLNSLFLTNNAELFQKIMPMLPNGEAGTPEKVPGVCQSLLGNANYDNRRYTFPTAYWVSGTYDEQYGGHYYKGLAMERLECPLEMPNIVSDTVTAGYRPWTYLGLENVVFAVSKGSTSGLATVSDKVVPSDYTALYLEGGEPMKMRVLNSSMTAIINSIKNSADKEVTSIQSGQTIKLTVTANGGNPSSVISILIFDENNKFIHYQPLDITVNGQSTYEFQIPSLTAGKSYKLAVVNEVYNDNTTEAADSSLISDTKTLKIVDPLSDLNVVPETVLVYGNDNSKGGSKVATITSKNGAELPTYTLVQDPAYPEDYKKFEIGSVDTSSLTHDANITIKGNSSTKLDAGTYHFKVQAQDANGDPTTPLEKEVSITISKTDQILSLGSTSKEYIEIDSGAVSKDSYTFSTTNTDTEFKPRFIMNGTTAGVVSVSVDPNNANKYIITPDSSYSGTALPETYTLEYTAPATKNYNAVTTPITREFVLYRKLSALTWAQKENLTTDQVNTNGSEVGTLVAVNGVGDFSYEILQPSDSAYDAATGSDYASFQLEKTSGAKDEKVKLKTTGALITKTYKLQVRVKDQMNNEVVKAITVQVDAAAQEKLYFVNESGTDITSQGISLKYTDEGVTLKVKGGSGTGAVTYALSTTQPSGITDAGSYLTVSSQGVLTPKDIGTVNVTATKAKDDTHSESSVTMTVTITKGEQSIAFANDAQTQLFEQDKTFDAHAVLKEKNKVSTRAITYSSSTESICTIDDQGLVTMLKIGICKLKAENTDAKYEAVSEERTIELYGSLSGDFIQKHIPQADDASGKATTFIGEVSAENGSGTKTFTIANLNSLLKVDSGTGEVTLRKDLHATDLKGKWNEDQSAYIITETIIVTDALGNQKEIEVNVKCKGAKITPAFEGAVNGIIIKEYGVNTYHTFTILNNTGNGMITYSIEANPSSELSDLNTKTGKAKVNHVSASGSNAKVKAEISEADGYDGATIMTDVIVTSGTQSISFDPSTQEKVQFEENGLFEIKAILTRKDGSSGDITYASTTPTICEITSSDKVKMLDVGTCTIKASNQDENYQEAEETKSIVLYNQATGSFTQVTTPQAEVDAKLDTALGTFTGEHGKGTLTYENSTDSSVKNQGASLIKIESDGTIRLKQDVSAADLASLATYKDGFYQVNFQVVIKDDGQEASTVDCVANIKGAPLADVRFKDEVNGIITKTYGDTFVLALLNNPGGTPTYSRKADDTLPKDVIDEKIEGSIVKILHANDPENANLPVIIANIPAANGYDAKEISAKVSINKAKQDGFKFRDENMNMKTESAITPLFEGAKSSEGITLTSGDETILTIINGDLKTAKKTGTVTVTATANEDRDYESKTITKDIIVYDNLSAAFKQKTPYPQANTDSAKEGTLVGQLSVDGGQGTITREVITGNEFITLPSASSNIVKLNKDITAEDLKGKWNDKVKAYVIETEIKFIDTLNDTVVGEFTLPVDIYFRGAPLPDISFADDDGNPTKLIQKPYVLNGDFLLTLTGNTGEGTVKYHLKDDDTMPDDVLVAVDEDGTVYIDNANDKEVNANDVIVQADIEPNKGYEGTTVECVVEIIKAKQDFDFKPKDQDIEMKVNETKTVEFTSTPKGGTVKLELKNPTDSTKLSISGTAITAQETGTVIIQATAPGGRNYEDAIREKNVIIYDDMNVTFTQNHIPQAETDTGNAGIPVGTINTTGGIGEVSAVIDETTLDGEYFRIDGDSIIINKAITIDSIKDKWNEEEQAYIMNVTVKLTDSKGNETDVTVPIKIQGAPLTDVAFKGKDGKPTYKIVKPYSKAPFKLELVDNSGGGTVRYKLKENVADMPTDVIKSITESGTVTIDNANEKTNTNKVWAIAEIGAKNGYDSATIEAEIYIEQAPQPNFNFKEKEVTLYYHGTMDTILQNKLSSGEVTYSSGATGIATVDENGTVTAYTTSGDAIITAICKEDRNYLSATATMIVHVIEGEAYPLVIEVPSMTYGDSPVQAEIKQQGAKGENLTQTWTSSDESIASIDEQGIITAHHAGIVTITLSQTSDGEPDVSTSVTLTVKPKPIEITIDNKEKLVGEEVPEFTIQPIEGLVGNDGDTFVFPELTCKDQKNNPVNELTPAGSYQIKGTILPSENPDYTITKVNEGTLVITEDKSTAAWYRLESEATRTQSGWYNKPVDVYIEEVSTPYDQIGNSINGPWSDHFTVSKEGINETDIYFRDSKTKAIASKQVAEIKIDVHDPKITSITGYKTNTEPLAKVINAITLDHFYQVGTEIEIVAEDPKPAGVNTISEIERIEYKLYRIIDKQKESEPFKEGSSETNPTSITINEVGIYDVCATAYDHAGNDGKTCQEIEVVEKEEPEEPEKPEECQKTDIKWSTTDGNGNTIWYTINEDTDKDGIPDRNIDSDGDGKPDINVDTDEDGKPDVNLRIITKDNWKPTKCVTQHDITYESHVDLKPNINVDLDIKSLEDYHKAIPDINIDTDGDMIPNLNITKENDTKPYLNVLPIKTWIPEQDCKLHGFVYDTMNWTTPLTNYDSDNDGRPDLNIDFDGNGIPDLNIDSDYNGIPDLNIDINGDGIPDYNIDVDENGKPTKNIYPFTEWKPKKNGIYESVEFDTMEIKGNSELEDNGIVVEKPDGSFLPNYAIKVDDVTSTKKEEVEKEASNEIKETQEIKAVYDVKLFENDVEVQPDGTLKVRIPIPDGISNPKLMIKKSDGSYEIISAKEENGYLIYETNELGIVSIVGDKEEITNDPKPTQDPEPTTSDPKQENPKPTVQKDYTDTGIGKNMGGVLSGDSSNICIYSIGFLVSLASLISILYKRKSKDQACIK